MVTTKITLESGGKVIENRNNGKKLFCFLFV